MVCEGDWEPRQPQDFVHGTADIMAPPWTRPESSDSFIPINYTNVLGISSTSSSTLTTLVIRYAKSTHELNGAVLNNTTLG